MSKPNSNLFKGTTGIIMYNAYFTRDYMNDIIKARIKELDLNKHPVKKRSDTPLGEIKNKIKNRTATIDEYKTLMQAKRLKRRRDLGVKRFWKKERLRILNNEPTTRNWNAQQMRDIITGKRPKFLNKTMQGHHTFSVKDYPHLADKGEIIFPVTFHEHLYGCHGGNYKKSKPGKLIKNIKDF